MVYSLLQELARRDALTIALSGRNETELYPLLKYLSRHMTKPRLTPLLLDVGNMLIGIETWHPSLYAIHCTVSSL